MMMKSNHSTFHFQRGVSLVVALVILLLLTLLGLGASQVTIQQERMAGNFRETNEAFQSAEETLREVEQCLVGIYSQGISGFCDAQRITWAAYEQELGFGIGDLNDCTLQSIANGDWESLPEWKDNSSIANNRYLLISLDDSEIGGIDRGSICRPVGEQEAGSGTYLIVAAAPGPAGTSLAVVQSIFYWRA